MTYIALGVFLGYIVAVSMFLVGTIGIASAAPSFAVREYRITTPYKLLQDVIWLVCTTVGGFAASLVVGPANLVWGGAVLTASLIFVLWRNSWETRQRGLPHQILLSFVTASGVALGFVLSYEILLKPVG